MLARVTSAENVRARDITWMLFRPDRSIRDTGAKLLMKVRDPETFDVFLGETKGKPEAAMRAAVSVFFSLNIPGIEQRVAQVLAPPQKETKETREMQEAARRLVAEAPLSKQFEPLLWQLASTGTAQERLQYLNRLAGGEADAQALARWQKLATDPDLSIKEKALEVLATKSPQASIELFVKELPNVGYATQQLLVDALTRAAEARGAEIVDKIPPLIASGDAGTRTAVMKILIGMGNPAAVIKRYVYYSKTLAGFVRDRALESMRAFGDALMEPAIELLFDPDPDVRAASISVASSFDDPRVVPATLELLKDPDWWIRIAATDTLGRLKDPRAVEPLVAALADPDMKWSAVEALGRIGDARALPALGRMLADPLPDVRIEVMSAIRNFNHPQVRQALMQMAQTDPERAVRTRAIDILDDLSLTDRKSMSQVDAVRKNALTVQSKEGEPRLNTMLIATRNQGASDFHLAVGQPPVIRLAAEPMRANAEPFTAEQTESMLKEVLSAPQWETLQTHHQLDFCYFIPQGGRYRGNVFFDHKGYNAVFRVIPEKP